MFILIKIIVFSILQGTQKQQNQIYSQIEKLWRVTDAVSINIKEKHGKTLFKLLVLLH